MWQWQQLWKPFRLIRRLGDNWIHWLLRDEQTCFSDIMYNSVLIDLLENKGIIIVWFFLLFYVSEFKCDERVQIDLSSAYEYYFIGLKHCGCAFSWCLRGLNAKICMLKVTKLALYQKMFFIRWKLNLALALACHSHSKPYSGKFKQVKFL